MDRLRANLTVYNGTMQGNLAGNTGGVLQFNRVYVYTFYIYNATFSENSAIVGGTISISGQVMSRCR